MKATAKYLPTTKADATAGMLGTIIVKEQAYEVAKKNSPELVHVKLFAVSQDIGFYPDIDKIWNDERNEYDKIKAEDKTMYVLNNCAVTKDKVYKVLGELSPKAIWVKDGEDIEIKLEREWKFSKWQKGFIAKVKNPTCKQYH